MNGVGGLVGNRETVSQRDRVGGGSVSSGGDSGAMVREEEEEGEMSEGIGTERVAIVGNFYKMSRCWQVGVGSGR